MDYTTFLQETNICKEDFFRHALSEDCKTVRIKKEKTIIKNLERIFEATFKICAKKGFQGMTMRDLSTESGLSMGGLYSYFSTKEELSVTLQRAGNTFVGKWLEEKSKGIEDPVEKLKKVIRVHLYLSEMMQPWFYFAYMEAKNLNRKERETAKQAELYTEKIIYDILVEAEKRGMYKARNHSLASAILKAALQDWYLKRWKYQKRDTTVDQYADFVIELISAFYVD